MEEMVLFNQGWKFLKTKLGVTSEQVLEQRKAFVPVDIPHDWLIYNPQNLYEDSCGWYLKSYRTGVSPEAGERVWLRFDGIYMDSTVYVNGLSMADWKYGYSAFGVDITPALTREENEILVQVRHQAPNSRWYSGAGIYRNVWLKEGRPLHLPLDGTYVSSKACEEGFATEVETEVQYTISAQKEEFSCQGIESDTGFHKAVCHYTLWKDNRIVQDLGRYPVEWKTPSEQAEGQPDSKETYIVNGLSKASVTVLHPDLWDIEAPNLYRLHVELEETAGGSVTDSRWVSMGFRTMEFLPDKGFFLNGRKVKVHGVCEHHDFGCLGAAFHKEAMRRKFLLLRRMGVNAIRTSHNMPAMELMELADEMGFLVVDEAFDMWERSKTTYDYARFFREWAERDVESWIRRDRNHPSLMLWSIGNEIYDTHADSHGQEITHRLINFVRRHDPKENAGITIGSNYMPWENAQKCADIVKLAGYNYGEKYYNKHHKEHPDWIIYGSETGSIVQSRGVYHFPLSQSTLAEEDEQCSALGNSTTSWGAKSVEKCITDDRDAEYAFGQFLWTGFDYIGEPTPYHTRNSYFGQLDTAGFPKDSYYIFQAEWTDAWKQPMVHVFPYWDFNEGQLIDVRACTNGAWVELFVNGESFGKQQIDHIRGKKLLGEWQVPYYKGEIKAVAYDQQGNFLAQETRTSFGDGVAVTLEADKTVLKADGEDLSFVTIGVLDAQGRPVENAMNPVMVTVEGAGRLLGLDNGDSTDDDSYKGSCRKLFNGKLLAVIGAALDPGQIKVTVRGEGLETAVLKLIAEKAQISQGICASENICTEDVLSDYGKPVRKVELRVIEEQGLKEGHFPTDHRCSTAGRPAVCGGIRLTKEQPQVMLEAYIYPADASDTRLIWKAVNDAGIEISFAKVEEVSAQGAFHCARVTAFGDGQFRIRCMSESGTGRVKIISQLEFTAEGLGKAFLNPYELISAGLYTDTIGEIGNGNEKGIATARDGRSGVIYTNIDFGEYGSDEITMSVFALSGDPYPIEIWQGRPGEKDSRLLAVPVYQKPSLWNVYQEETWKLKERIKGVTTIAFVLEAKVHIKGFSFKYYEKALSRLYAAECSQVYGDSFHKGSRAVTGIGNNVTLKFPSMDFGKEGVTKLTISGFTSLETNSIHIHFTKDEGETVNRIVEFVGTGRQKENADPDEAAQYVGRTFSIEKLEGRGIVEFIFLPGASFDFYDFQFER